MSPARGAARTAPARLATVVGGLALLVGLGTTVARSVTGVPGLAGDTWAMVTTFTDAGALAYAVALAGFGTALALRFRAARLVALLVTLVLTALHLSWLVPGYLADHRPAADGTEVVVLAQNMLFGRADPAAVTAAARDVDVLVLTEITGPAAEALAAAGLTRTLPHQSGGALPGTGASGTRVYSRFPVRDSRPLDAALGDHHWVVELEVPGLGPLTVVAVHPTRPVRGGARWAPEQARLRERLPHQHTVVAGDFNAVDAHPGMRRLHADGFADADDLVGAGWQPTYPAEGWLPPLVAIDHVLVSSDLTATGFTTVELPGTDHRGVRATVALRG